MIVDIEDDIMDPVMQCTTLPIHSSFSQKKLVSFVTEIHTLSIDILLRDYALIVKGLIVSSTSTSKDASQSQHKSSDKSVHAEEPSHTIEDSGMQQDQEFFTGDNDEQPTDKEISQAALAEEPPTSFDEFNDTSFDFSVFVMNQLKIPNLTQEILEVILFYNGLDVLTRQILDSRGVVPTKTTADTKTAIQEMAEYSQKWHNGTSRGRSIETSDGLAAIQAQLNNLRREIKKVNEKVYVAQVGCEQCKDPITKP
ncbi:hypothetical protein Tco_0876889 [Tanacetum coccineum]|uniref:Uncharacterized protein n=1 Tax=Tanacetum coccineum TaxID=301880 RepID=A0ABQ5BX09_9ASTR